MSRTDIVQAKAAAEVSAIKRREQLRAWNDYTAFVVTKGVGLVTLFSGSIGLINPDYLPIHLQHDQSETAIGIGLALLAGNQIVSLVSKVVGGLKQ